MLTDAGIRAAKPRERPYKLADGGGLYLHITPQASKLWRMRYSCTGKEKVLSFGPYPEVTLAQAREQRDVAKGQLRAGRDPGLEKKFRRAAVADMFEAIARDWYGRQAPKWTARHAGEVLESLERDVFPMLGGLPIREITPPMVLLQVLRPIEARGAIETAHRVRQRISAVFVYAIAVGVGEADPAASVKAAMAPVTKGRQPAITDLNAAREILARVEATPAHPVTKLANRLLALTVVRPGEIRGAAWSEFEDLDGDAPLWRIPAARMKAKRDHMVPLARQSVEVLKAVHRLTGRGSLVFPNNRFAHRPISENAIGYLLNRAGYHGRHVPHGWRATFSTIMNERYRADRHIIDLMLAHALQDKTEAAYNRAVHIERRRQLTQEWADLLLDGASSAEVLLQGSRKG